ncbi:hypothetical protein OCU04_006017 [Sclerotinia nivalis]|uniref:Uncharacterized protein n=1 Tax=Sclerotinia nivalis TaxID=352851 RepID=A0A9X0DKU4_9HELO|nr:hypothetical protein OCU04_006017 [Sclerotinia nivalis]
MRSTTLLFTLVVPAIMALAKPVQMAQARALTGLEQRGAHLDTAIVARAPADGGDDDDAIAYAWFNEDGTEKQVEARAPADGADDDDAIAYAWFNEDGTEKEVEEK